MDHQRWLEEPYQQMYAEEDRLTCPDCGEQMRDLGDEAVQCPGCGFEAHPQTEPDWDAIREERREQAEDYPEEFW